MGCASPQHILYIVVQKANRERETYNKNFDERNNIEICKAKDEYEMTKDVGR